MFNNKIDVAKGFQTSVNIAYDLNNTGKISGFIPTMSSLDIIEDVLLSTAPNSTERARILIGAYGRGKSHIILVLLSLLYKIIISFNLFFYIISIFYFIFRKINLCRCSSSF